MALAITASVIGTPALSIEQPPTNASSVSKPTARCWPIQSAVFTTSAIASGPIPSPGSSRIDLFAVMSRVLPAVGGLLLVTDTGP